MNVLEVKELRKSFGKLKAVDGVSFGVPDGKIFGLIGRNGAGKTTTIRMMMNIFAPDSGQVLFRGSEISEDFRSRVGYLPEERGLYKKMKVLDTILFFADVKGFPIAKATPIALEYLKKFELLDRKNSKVEELSKGNQQKIQFICTILHNPDFIILDEPFSGLDPVNIELLKEIIGELKSQGKVIILSTHLMDFAEKLCDNIVMIDKGQVKIAGEVGDIKSRFAGDLVTVHPEGDVSFISQLPFVESVEKTGNYYSIRLKNKDFAGNLLQAFVERHVTINRYALNEISLHQIFVKIAGDESGKGVN